MQQHLTVKPYILAINGTTTLLLPRGAKALSVMVSSTNDVLLHVLIDNDARHVEEREFYSAPSCVVFAERLELLKYIGSVYLHTGQGGFHIFEILRY